MRFFTTEGPVRAADNYCLPPLQRWDLDEVLGLIDQKKCFLLHAPRQTGKASCLLALMEYLNQKDGTLNPAQLLDAFLAFWRCHGQPLLGSAPYHEIAPHLVLMAFLHRVSNGGGTLEREYAIGSGRMDLCLSYGALTLGMELKVWRDGAPDPLAEGLDQLDGYLAGLGLDWGWLVIFGRRAGQPPMAERTASREARSPQGRRIVVVRA